MFRVQTMTPNSLDTEKPTVQIVSPTVDQGIEPGHQSVLKLFV
ncbi:hypothetical protein QW060_17535 [Myroides ceti]|uniref:Uncharacterized protein n=1 Tax=Paenimyroides ceti TaxID=395087 RepID=A0ABT8D0Q7_9FLAO|nr:hypothetical protein [Paenimyroides ceti]MDN3708892.1 hypothetical protein [Paenimyroides ceti]